MNQITDPIQSQLHDPLLIQMNPMIPQPDYTPIIRNHPNLPINQIGNNQQIVNIHQNEDTSTILFLI